MMDSADRAQRCVCLRVRNRSTACGVYAVDSAAIVNMGGVAACLRPLVRVRWTRRNIPWSRPCDRSSVLASTGGSPKVRWARSVNPIRKAEKPFILAVDDEPAVLSAVAGDLRREYGRQYRVS